MDILIAEDETITRAMLTKVLEENGHRLTVTENGLQAWERLQTSTIGLVITDWMMPQMDGLTLCRKIRNASFEHYIYIIMLTAKDDKKDMLTVLNSGADDYIKKPFDPDELMARVRTGIRSIEREERLRRMQQDILNVAANIKMKNAKLEAAMSKLGNGTGEPPPGGSDPPATGKIEGRNGVGGRSVNERRVAVDLQGNPAQRDIDTLDPQFRQQGGVALGSADGV